MSDLHTEFYHGSSIDMLLTLQFLPNLDFLLLPGDIIVPASQPEEECREVFDFLSKKARFVLYTKGNHEYYGCETGAKTDSFINSILPPNFIGLENAEVTLDGVHFYGGAMWFPDQPFNRLHEHEINDFALIPDIHDWVYARNTEFHLKAKELVRPETVVLTHHLPSHMSTPKIYRDSTINCFFVSDESDIILNNKPRIWLHGHTHHACEYKLGETNVLCNPYGYPKERRWMPKYAPVAFEL